MPDRLSRNIIANVLGLATNVAVGVIFTPYLVRRLGVDAYGLVPLATSVTSYLTVFTLVVNAAVARFITVALERADIASARRYFNTSLFASCAVALVVLVTGGWLALHSDRLFVIPAGLKTDTQWLVAFTVSVVVISVLSATFEVSSFCSNRFDLRNAVVVASTLLRVALVVVLFSYVSPNVRYVGCAAFAGAVAALIAAVALWRRLTPELEISWAYADLAALKELASAGGWSAVNQLGTLLILSIDLLVVNRAFGVTEAGRYASILQWPMLLRALAMTLAGVLAPTIVALYARGDLDGLVKFSRLAVKILGLAMALPVGVIAGLGSEILQLWLGPEFASLSPLLVLMTLPLALNLGYLPLHNIATATNNVRWPGIVQVLAGGLNLALAICFVRFSEWGLYGVAAAGIAVLTLRNVVFTPYYGALLIGKTATVFAGELPVVLLATCAVFLISRAGAAFLGLTSWSTLLVFGAVAALGYTAVVWKFALTGDERRAFVRRQRS